MEGIFLNKTRQCLAQCLMFRKRICSVSSIGTFQKTPTLVDDMPVQSVKLYDWNTETVVCDAVSAVIDTAAEIFPNDPAVTSIPDSAFPGPLRYDYR